MDNFHPIDLDRVRTLPLSERKNKVNVKNFARICSPKSTVKDLLESLPKIQIGNDFQSIVDSIIYAYSNRKPVIFGIGGHVIKCGLSPWLLELMRQGVVTAIAMNGASSIHDFEIALIGETSEDVTSGLRNGTFGMSKETGEYMHQALCRSEVDSNKMGMGEALGKKLVELNPDYIQYSILANAVKMKIPVTVHIALGTDIIHMHSNSIGELAGKASFTDFRLFISIISSIANGGVYINFGSSVILPEVFQKSLTVAQNLGFSLEKFVTANFSMEQSYRPTQNVVLRPSVCNSVGYSVIGHHELTIPFLSCSVIQKIMDIE